MAILIDSSDLRKTLELEEVPHYTTLQKAARRLTEKKFLDRLMRGFLGIAQDAHMMRKAVTLSAIDSTGFESHYRSSYFVERKRSAHDSGYEHVYYRRFPKVGIVADCAAHLVIAGVPSWGPGPDLWHWYDAIREATRQTTLKVLTEDAGYDSEQAHKFAREEHGIRTIIRNRVGRPTRKLPSGRYRRIMATRFNKVLYGQRWQIETVNSIIKRRLGSFLRARTYWSQMR
jgi:Transposase DDE domain